MKAWVVGQGKYSLLRSPLQLTEEYPDAIKFARFSLARAAAVKYSLAFEAATFIYESDDSGSLSSIAFVDAKGKVTKA